MLAMPAKAMPPTEPIWKPDSLPPFPAVALKALKLMAGTDTSLIELCNLIRSDPAFSTAVLRIANSPLVAFSKDVTSVLQASMLLGFRRLKSIVITVGLKAYLKEPFTPVQRACWRHSVACALIAERTALWSGFDKDFAYTAGILHDIGRIAMVATTPQAYFRTILAGAARPSDLLQIEREQFGIDHCQAGRLLVAAWNLPEAYLDVASLHHDANTAARGAMSVLSPSCALADALGFGLIRCDAPSSYPDVLRGFREAARERFPIDYQEFALEIGNEINLLEAV